MPLFPRKTRATALASFVAAAVIAAHGAGEVAGGFSASDVRFFFQLFTNFVEHDPSRSGEDLELTQVGRILVRLRGRGWLGAGRRPPRGRGRAGPRYVATTQGLVGLVTELVDEATRRSFEEALFAAQFVASYGPAIVRRADAASQAELRRLLDERSVLRRARAHLARVEADLDERARSGLELAAEIRTLRGRSRDVTTILARLNRPGIYQLAGVRPYGEILTQLPPDLLAFELDHAVELRARRLFQPLARRARAQREIVDALLAGR